MSKIKLRENLFKLVYQYVIAKNKECDFEILDEANLSDEEKTLLLNHFNEIIFNYENITKIIEDNLIKYKLERICKTDLSILVIAIYEINYLKEPYKMVINEAVELSKKYSLDNSYKFVNGLLAKVVDAV